MTENKYNKGKQNNSGGVVLRAKTSKITTAKPVVTAKNKPQHRGRKLVLPISDEKRAFTPDISKMKARVKIVPIRPTSSKTLRKQISSKIDAVRNQS